jgi:peptidoglycan/xylan/chitin deacetylase (PgdA/CDA1 family)
LGVPTGAILDHTLAPWTERLDLANELAFAEPARGGFCTWTELEEIMRSGRVALAAHGHHHVPLDTTDADLTTEIDLSQARLQERLAQPVNSFVFPFGRYSRRALNRAVQRYRHVFRIGGAINRGWDRNPLYRVDADQMTSPDALFTASHLSTCRFRYVWNRLRGR